MTDVDTSNRPGDWTRENNENGNGNENEKEFERDNGNEFEHNGIYHMYPNYGAYNMHENDKDTEEYPAVIKTKSTQLYDEEVAGHKQEGPPDDNYGGAGPPPDGGLLAWTQVIMAHLVTFNTWGYVTSFGVFQSYYTESLGRSPSDISWVGSVQVFLLFFVGIFSGRASDSGYFRTMLLSGAVLEIFCIMMTSLCTQYWQLFLAQGIGQSIGAGMMFCPTTALTPTYFTSKRTFAMGIVASGSATGGMVFPAVVLRLLPRVGYPWTMRTLGFIALGSLTPSLILLRQRVPPRKAGPLVEWAAFKEAPYSLFTVGMFLNFCGIYVGYFYIGSFGRNIIGVSETVSVYVLLVMNGVGLPMRLIPALCASKFTGPLNILVPSSFATGLVTYGWPGVKSLGGLYAWTVIYGSVAASFQALFPGTLGSLTNDLQRVGVRMGMVFAVLAIAALIGSPIAGALVQADRGAYLYAQMFMASCITAGSLVLVACRVARLGFRIGRV